ncbi:ATPase, T2SS/T4P/T4SS family, partial [Paracraurococcus ruber]
ARLGLAPGPVWRPRGCAACRGTGYRGRSAVLQVMPMSEALCAAVLRRADAGALHALAEAEGMPGLRAAALRKVQAGITSLDEVMRVMGGG